MTVLLTLLGAGTLVLVLWRVAASDYDFSPRFSPKTLRGRFVYLGVGAILVAALVIVMRLARGHWG